ncbi:hypothetical protein IMZ48_49445 [Candidatus Bathyarchaeota archaeon]|nr:hypothetical protein [Candidatus Bathyarchaeota archaeon]
MTSHNSSWPAPSGSGGDVGICSSDEISPYQLTGAGQIRTPETYFNRDKACKITPLTSMQPGNRLCSTRIIPRRRAVDPYVPPSQEHPKKGCTEHGVAASVRLQGGWKTHDHGALPRVKVGLGSRGRRHNAWAFEATPRGSPSPVRGGYEVLLGITRYAAAHVSQPDQRVKSLLA